MYISPFFSLFLFHSCSLAKKTIMSVALVFIFYDPYEIMTKDDNECNVHYHLLLFLWNEGRRKQQMCFILVFFSFFSCIAKDNDEPPHSLSFSIIKILKKNRNLKEDDKPFGSSSSSTTQEKKSWCWFFLGCRRQQWASWLIIVS